VHTGSVTVDMAPPTEAFAAFTLPPCARVIAATIDSPRPAPPGAACAAALVLPAPEALDEVLRLVGWQAGAVVANT
jgi:hypothetical protein